MDDANTLEKNFASGFKCNRLLTWTFLQMFLPVFRAQRQFEYRQKQKFYQKVFIFFGLSKPR